MCYGLYTYFDQYHLPGSENMDFSVWGSLLKWHGVPFMSPREPYYIIYFPGVPFCRFKKIIPFCRVINMWIVVFKVRL